MRLLSPPSGPVHIPKPIASRPSQESHEEETRSHRSADPPVAVSSGDPSNFESPARLSSRTWRPRPRGIVFLELRISSAGPELKVRRRYPYLPPLPPPPPPPPPYLCFLPSCSVDLRVVHVDHENGVKSLVHEGAPAARARSSCVPVAGAINARGGPRAVAVVLAATRIQAEGSSLLLFLLLDRPVWSLLVGSRL